LPNFLPGVAGIRFALLANGVVPMKNDRPPVESPDARLERVFIDEYLEARGHTRRSVLELPPVEAETLLRAASEHASLRLAEIESRARYIDEIHRPS
jgi:hypothetical protein